MTKILVISDSHGRKDLVSRVVKEHFDSNFIFHLGDFSQDMWDFAYEENIYVVKGNMDPFLPKADYAKEEIFVDTENIKIWLLHGHRYEAHFSTQKMLDKAIKNGLQLVCYGHTHKAEFQEKNGVYFFNPGALKSGEYGLIFIENGNIKAELRVI